MADELLRYYESELAAINLLAQGFASDHKQRAARLYLEEQDERDPHVERLIQAFAFLTARVRQKLDDDLPELSEALLQVLYPHYLAPVPSLSMVQFVADPHQGKLTDGHRIDPGNTLATDPVDGVPCRFRTCYPVTLWPLEIEQATFEMPRAGTAVRGAGAMLRLRFRCTGATKLEELTLDRLRLFIDGTEASKLYEAVLNRDAIEARNLHAAVEVRGEGGAPPVLLPRGSLRPVGFASDEGLLPYPPRSFVGYQLLQEYFCFPAKFLFVDIVGLEAAVARQFGERFEICIYVDREPALDQPLTAETFRLGVTPVVNLFPTTADAVRVDYTRGEYLLTPDRRRKLAMEVYGVDGVRLIGSGPDPVPVEPFHAFRHSLEQREQRVYWSARRQPSTRKGDPGTEVYLSLVDGRREALAMPQTLNVHITCSNRDLPASLTWDEDRFHLEGKAPISRVRCLRRPTKSIYGHLERETQWQLLSHLSLNYLSLVGDNGEALRELLRLYCFDREQRGANHQQINGIIALASRRVVRRPRSMPWNGFCRGIEVTLGLREESFIGGGAFLFASVVEAFLGLYASINSFTQLVATVKDGREKLKQWPPRAGEQILI